MAAGTLKFVIGNNAGPQQELELDAILSQQHALDADVTQYPVEKGVQPADHIEPKAEVLSLEALIAEWRFGDQPPPAIGPQLPASRVPEAMATLILIRDTGTLVDFVSGQRELKSLALSGLRLSFDSKSNGALRFSCTLTQVRVVETRTVAIKRTKTPKGNGPVNEGVKATTAEVPNPGSPLWQIDHPGEDGTLLNYTPVPRNFSPVGG